MNEFSYKWEDIAQRGHSAGRFRVFPDHLLDFFLDISLNGRREVMVEANTEDLQVPILPIFQNFDLTISKTSSGLRFCIFLNDEDLSQSFSVMCYDMAQRSMEGQTVAAALQIFLTALNHWADLFKQKQMGGLTLPETMGLLGELLVIEGLIINDTVDKNLVIQGWRGPNGDARDIGYNGSRIEVKTQLSTKATTLLISTLDQLDDRGEKLHVVLNRISPADSGQCLNEVVDRLYLILNQSRHAYSEFERKLELASYKLDSNFAFEKFGLDQRIVYLVNDSFPRLTHQNVPQGIISASYVIRGKDIEQHETSWAELLGAING